MPKTKKDKERDKAKAGQLFISSRPVSRSQTPVTPDPDLESVQLASRTSDTSQNQVYQQAPSVFGAVSAPFMQSTQIIAPPDPTPLDPDTIPPTHLSKTDSYSQDPLLRATSTAPIQVSPETARLPSSVSLSQTPFISNNNQNTTYNYGGHVLNYNPVTNNVYLTKEEENVVKSIKSAIGHRFVPAALHKIQPEEAGCMPGTRVSVLSMFMEWAKNDPMRIFWLAGLAGTGKTSIAVTLCRMLENDRTVTLGGSFFCSRTANMNELTDARCILPTLAATFAQQYPVFATALAAELSADESAALNPISTQIMTLLQRPLTAVASSVLPIIFVIDALDECSNENEVKTLLRAISNLKCETKVKFIVTSRPETHISTSPISVLDYNSILRLHTIDKTHVTEDIRLYISDAFSKETLDGRWYTESDVDLLATRADGLFIFASTVVTYILDTGSVKSRAARLRTAVFAMKSSRVMTRPLDAVYEFVLTRASDSEKVEPEELAATLKVLSSILMAKMPLSIIALAEILGWASDDLRDSLRRLHSVVHVPVQPEEPGLRTVHASFGDYLFERAATELRIVPALGDEALVRGCLKIMGKRLHFNISQCRSSFEPNSSTKPDSVTYSLEYACLQWVYHLADLPQPWVMERNVDDIFRSQLLFWLEVMSVLGQVRRAGAMLNLAVTLIRSSDFSHFMRDANIFAVSSLEAIERSAPHIYLSALPFAARSSRIRASFLAQCTGLASVATFGIDSHGGQAVMSLAGHTGSIMSMAYLPDGRLASGSSDNTVRIWDTQTGYESMPPFISQDGTVLSVAVAGSGKSLALGTYSGAVCIWNLEAHRDPPRRFLGHLDPVNSVSFSTDDSLIASVASDGLRLWRAETGQPVSMTCETTAIRTVVFSPDCKMMASCFDFKTQMWDVSTGNPVAVDVLNHEVSVWCICFSPDCLTFAAGLNDSTIQLWDMTTRTVISTLRGHSADVYWVQFSPDDRSLVSMSTDRIIHFWNLHPDLGDRDPVVFRGKPEYGSPALSPDGLYIALRSSNSTIQIWDAGVDVGQKATQSFHAHTSCVRSVAVSNNGAFIASGSDDGSVRIWDACNGEPKLPALVGHDREVTCVAISPNNRVVASGSADSTVRLWDVATGKAIGKPLRGHSSYVSAVTFSFDSQWLASASHDETVRIWDVESHQESPIGPFQCSVDALSVTFSPDGRTIAAGDLLGRIHLWNTDTGQQTCEPLDSDQGFNAKCPIAFSPIRMHILSGGARDGIARVWEIATRQQDATLEGHTDGITSVAYSSDGLAIATGSKDRTVMIWDAQAGTNLAVVHGHDSWVDSMVFMPCRKYLVSGSWDSTIRVWDLKAAQAQSLDDEMEPSGAVERRGLQDGWLLGEAGELLLWVPKEYRAFLKLPSCRILIGTHRVEIKTEGKWHRGENWTECWLGDRS